MSSVKKQSIPSRNVQNISRYWSGNHTWWGSNSAKIYATKFASERRQREDSPRIKVVYAQIDFEGKEQPGSEVVVYVDANILAAIPDGREDSKAQLGLHSWISQEELF